MHMKAMALAMSAAFSASALAQSAELDTISVTAHPIIEETLLDRFSATSSVVTEAQLRDQNAVDLAAALRRTPGVEISRYNPVGSFGGDQGGAVFIRGLGISRPGSEIKTYIDGIPFYMGVWNHPLLDLLPTNGMKSITVHKSPQPYLNGNNFASINLETKRATQDGIHGSGRVSYGTYNTVMEQADLSGRSGPLDFMLAQGFASSDGHRPNADGRLNNAMGRIGLAINEHWAVGASFLAVNNTAKDPYDNRQARPAVAPEYKTDATMATTFLTHSHGDWRGELRVYGNQGEGNLYNDNRPMVGWGTFLTRFSMNGVRWKEELSPWKNGTVVFGIDHDRLSGSVKGPNTGGMGVGARIDMPDFTLTSPFVALSQKFDLNQNWSLVPSIGARHYDHNEYASETAPHAGISLVSEKLTLFANASRGVNYPGLEMPALQAAIPFMFAGQTWKTLSPEKLNHREIGMKLTPTDTTQIDLSLFRDDIKNRNVFDLAFGSTVFYSTGGYHTDGAELSVRQQLGGSWEVFGGLTLLDPSVDNLPYIPKRAFTAGVNGNIGPLRLAVDAQYQSSVYALNRDRNTLNPNREKVDSFTVANARLSYPMPTLGKKGEVFVAVDNLFNTNYEYRPGYPMPGRMGQIGLAASF